ncbi:transmembrane protein 273 [Pezoporus wallicus]|uniref:transmembrane protein 273 n=1 Tax=Pezoporus wallicus TaxID=35540 RepID=UPI002550DDCD|nr:transmembrane protein 273 [Pezoporus wallicus]
MTFLTRWVSVLLAFLLLHFWRTKVYASGNSEEEIDFTYVIIGVTLGAFLAITFVAVIICMIKKQMIDNVFRGKKNTTAFSVRDLDLLMFQYSRSALQC